MSQNFTLVPTDGLNDVNANVWNLHALINVTHDLLQERGSFGVDGKRDDTLDSVSALLWIARDLAMKSASDIDYLFTEKPPAK